MKLNIKNTMSRNGTQGDYLLGGAAGSGGGALNKTYAELGGDKGSADTIRARNSKAIKVQPMDSCTSLTSILCFPCTFLGGFYVSHSGLSLPFSATDSAHFHTQAVGPRSVVLNTHNGLLTSVEEEQGCHWVTPMCREQHYITTKEVTYRLPDTKVAGERLICFVSGSR